jgi:hypothetical protein
MYRCLRMSIRIVSSEHDTGRLHCAQARFPCICTVCLLLLCCLVVLCAHPCPCRAQEVAAEPSDNQTLHISFLSLKFGSSIGATRLRLHADGTLDLSIENETLSGAGGAWALQGNRFSATADFSVDRRAAFHYRLIFNGYHMMGLYAGRTRLQEYDRRNHLVQEISFLFYADARTRAGKDAAQ